MTRESRHQKLSLKILYILLFVIALIAFLLAAVRCGLRLPVADYYKNSEKAFLIPGISDNLVVQGLCYDEKEQLFLITGYRTDGKASQVSIVRKTDGKELKKINLLDQEGKAFRGHVGGIAIYGEYVYIAGGRNHCVYVYAYKDFGNALNGDHVKCLGSISTGVSEEDHISVAFVTVFDGQLYVGEFYRAQNYPTPDSHKITTKAGAQNTALMISFDFDADAEFGVSSEISAAYSLPGLVQGVVISEDRIYLSTSYGVAFSHIYVYDRKKLAEEGDITLLGKKAKLYALDSSSLLRDIKAPPMAEEIVKVDGKLYTMCESATNKYIFGKFTSAKYCYATTLAAYED